MSAWITQNSHEHLLPFFYLVLFCYLNRVQFTPTLFNFLGGTGTTAGLGATTGYLPGGSGESWTDVLAEQPPWQDAVIFSSGKGWDRFYWDPEQVGTSDPGRPVRLNEQYTLRLWYDRTDTYRMRCALRKGLFLAAFSDALGTYLASLEAMFRGWDPAFALSDVIPYFECGNEVNAYWNTSSGGHQELARYATLLAGPLLRRVPSARFRFAELGSDNKDELNHASEFSTLVSWLATSRSYAVRQEYDRWTALLGRTDPDASEWRLACLKAGFQWPPASGLPFRGARLFQQVGFHWFHSYDTPASPKLYLSALNESSDITQMSVAFPSMSLAMAAVGFQAAEAPPASSQPYYADTNPRFQASMLLRIVLVALASGVEQTGIFSFIATPPWITGAASWTRFSSMGLRNDMSLNAIDYTQEESVYRRPSWFALRRLVWLLAQSSSMAAYRMGHVVCLQLESLAGFSSDPTRRSARGPRYAYIASYDQGTSGLGGAIRLTLTSRQPRVSYETISLVPDVDQSRLTNGADGEYPREGSVSWAWAGGENVAFESKISARYFGTQMTFVLLPADPTANPGLTCILTDADAVDLDPV